MLGPGRMGQGIAIALGAAGHRVLLLARTPQPVRPPLLLHTGPWDAATRDARVIVVAVPDDAIDAAAHALAERAALRPEHAVLH
ncbi:MAG: NAD(P)-binding domain-containing protein, partial [Gemmatimonadales bacterium]